MKILPYIFFLFLPLLLQAQGDMRVYTVAGSLSATALGDGGPALDAKINNSEGIWMDGNCNIYICDVANARVRKVNLRTNIITTFAGTGLGGYSGDGGAATNAQIKGPYGLFVDNNNNVYFTDGNLNNRIRRVDATTGIITTFAGGGSSTGDGGLATNAQLTGACNVYGDTAGNIYIAESGRIRKVSNGTSVISTIAGTGISGFSGDNGPATNAQLSVTVAGMLLDKDGHLLIADRGNNRIRKINKTSGLITTVAGTTQGYSGDGGPATNAQLNGPISLFIDINNSIIIGDNQNNYIRVINPTTNIINTIAGVGPSSIGSSLEGVLATNAEIHPEFLYLDIDGNLYFSNYGRQIRKITGFEPGIHSSGSVCSLMEVNITSQENDDIFIYPNPTSDELYISVSKVKLDYYIIKNYVGNVVKSDIINNSINIGYLPQGVYYIYFIGNDIKQVKKIIKL